MIPFDKLNGGYDFINYNASANMRQLQGQEEIWANAHEMRESL